MTGGAQPESQRSRAGTVFDLTDLNSSGELGAEDIEALAEQLAGHLGFAAGSPQHAAVKEATGALWQDLLQDLGLSGGDRISRKQYVDFYANATPGALRQSVTPFTDLLFDLFDTDGDGRVSRSEFEAYHRSWGIPADRIQETFQQLDSAGAGFLSKEQLHQYLSGFILGSAD